MRNAVAGRTRDTRLVGFLVVWHSFLLGHRFFFFIHIIRFGSWRSDIPSLGVAQRIAWGNDMLSAPRTVRVDPSHVKFMLWEVTICSLLHYPSADIESFPVAVEFMVYAV